MSTTICLSGGPQPGDDYEKSEIRKKLHLKHIKRWKGNFTLFQLSIDLYHLWLEA